MSMKEKNLNRAIIALAKNLDNMGDSIGLLDITMNRLANRLDKWLNVNRNIEKKVEIKQSCMNNGVEQENVLHETNNAMNVVAEDNSSEAVKIEIKRWKNLKERTRRSRRGRARARTKLENNDEKQLTETLKENFYTNHAKHLIVAATGNRDLETQSSATWVEEKHFFCKNSENESLKIWAKLAVECIEDFQKINATKKECDEPIINDNCDVHTPQNDTNGAIFGEQRNDSLILTENIDNSTFASASSSSSSVFNASSSLFISSYLPPSPILSTHGELASVDVAFSNILNDKNGKKQQVTRRITSKLLPEKRLEIKRLRDKLYRARKRAAESDFEKALRREKDRLYRAKIRARASENEKIVKRIKERKHKVNLKKKLLNVVENVVGIGGGDFQKTEAEPLAIKRKRGCNKRICFQTLTENEDKKKETNEDFAEKKERSADIRSVAFCQAEVTVEAACNLYAFGKSNEDLSCVVTGNSSTEDNLIYDSAKSANNSFNEQKEKDRNVVKKYTQKITENDSNEKEGQEYVEEEQKEA